MRLPASITAQPSDPTDAQHPALTYVDPADVSDVEQTPAERKPWWARVSSAIAHGAFTNAAAALIAVAGAVYVGMVHAPWVRSVAGYRPTAEQASNAVSVAMAASPAGAAMPQPVEPAAPAESEPAPQPDPVAVARGRMEQRVYAQVRHGPTRAVAQKRVVSDGGSALDSGRPAAGRARRHHHGARHASQGSHPWNTKWYQGA